MANWHGRKEFWNIIDEAATDERPAAVMMVKENDHDFSTGLMNTRRIQDTFRLATGFIAMCAATYGWTVQEYIECLHDYCMDPRSRNSIDNGNIGEDDLP